MAVVLVLLFHAGFEWMPGGYLGVSVFFTLSGYLITTLLLSEHSANGRVSLPAFYARRARRLLPASMLCLVAVMLARMVGRFDRVDGLRRDGLAALLQVFNWVRLDGGTSYGDLFSDPTGATVSPLEHYWSLAIEEQFYIVWPVALIGLILLARRRRRRVTASIFALTVLFGVLAPIIATKFGPDAAYWATPARLAEILVGASLAAVMLDHPTKVSATDPGRTTRSGSDPTEPGSLAPVTASSGSTSRCPGSRSIRGRTSAGSRPMPRALTAIGNRRGRLALPALVSIIAIATLAPSGRGPAYQGVLPVFALVSATLIWSLQAPSAVRRALSAPPVVLIGRMSYGVYLFHWPIFVLVRQSAWNLSRWDGFTVAVVVTGGVAAVSYGLLEQPIRRARWPGVRLASVGMIGFAAVTAVLAITPAARPFLEVDTRLLNAAAIQPAGSLLPLMPIAAAPPTNIAPPTNVAPPTNIASLTTSTTSVSTIATTIPTATTTSTTTTSTTTRSMTTSVTTAVTTSASTGTAFNSTAALPDAAPSRPVRILVLGDSTSLYLGQGLAAWSLDHPGYAQASVSWSQGCGFILDGTITSFEATKFVEGSSNLIRNDLPATVASLRPDAVVLMTTINDVTDRRWSASEGSLRPENPVFRERMRDAYASLQEAIVAMGVPRVVWIIPPVPIQISPYPELNEPLRYDVQHEIIKSVAASGSSRVGVVDLDEWFERSGAAEDGSWRPDGVHMTVESATDLATWFLGPELVNQVLDTA